MNIQGQTSEEILVIKHGALGDMVLCTGPFAAIRAAHPNARITLLTTKPFAGLMARSPFFDAVECDSRPKWYRVGEWLKIIRFLRSRQWAWVYDLQTSARSTGYFSLFAHPKPHFSGIAKKASHPHLSPTRVSSHTIDRQREQLRLAGITEVPAADIRWLSADVSGFSLASPYALLVAGGSAHRPEKRWTPEGFAQLAAYLLQVGITPVLIGTQAEATVIEHIMAKAPQGVVSLLNQTDFGQLAELARHAACAVGNDTGPMHIIAATGCQSLVLFSHASNPDLCAPRGSHISILRKPTLQELKVHEVLETMRSWALADPLQAGDSLAASYSTSNS